MKRQGIQKLWENSYAPVPAARMSRRARRRRLTIISSSIALLVTVLLIAALATSLFSRTSTFASSVNTSNRGLQVASTINQLNRISVVGSTEFIVDGHGRTITADANPYGIAIAPKSVPNSRAQGTLRPGDVVVTNIGANDTGTTLVRFPAGRGPGLLFNTIPSAATKGPAFQAFNALSGTDWVANIATNVVQVFRPNGSVLATVTNPLFNRPWGQATSAGLRNRADGSVISFFVSNAGSGTIDRIDVIPSGRGTIFRIFQIAQVVQVKTEVKINITWVPSLQVGKQRFTDVLLALDPLTNRVVAFPNSTTTNTTNARSTNRGITVFQGRPLNAPGGLTVNPLNGDLLVVNLKDNNLVELNLTRGLAVGVRQLDNVPVDRLSGNGSALFGVAATRDGRGNLLVFFTDDNTNTLNTLSV